MAFIVKYSIIQNKIKGRSFNEEYKGETEFHIEKCPIEVKFLGEILI
jgi:hypothetical protein